MESKLSGPSDINVICIMPYRNFHGLEMYKVGKTYRARYLYDKCLLDNNDYIEYEWQVFCAQYNHYQFTEVEFRKFFVDVAKQRDEKIYSILNI